MRLIVISCLVFVPPLLVKFWKVQPNLPKYFEFVAKFLYVHMVFCDCCKDYNIIWLLNNRV